MFNANNYRYPSFNDFKNMLSRLDSNYLQRIQEEARKRGISEQDIQQGMEMIQRLKKLD